MKFQDFVKIVASLVNQLMSMWLKNQSDTSSTNVDVATNETSMDQSPSQEVLVKRNPSEVTADGLFGTLYVDGVRICDTCENRALALDCGSYWLTKYLSPKNGCEVPLINGTGSRSFCEIHICNHPNQLEGCISVGTLDLQDDDVDSSGASFKLLMSKLDFSRRINLTIE